MAQELVIWEKEERMLNYYRVMLSNSFAVAVGELWD